QVEVTECDLECGPARVHLLVGQSGAENTPAHDRQITVVADHGQRLRRLRRRQARGQRRPSATQFERGPFDCVEIRYRHGNKLYSFSLSEIHSCQTMSDTTENYYSNNIYQNLLKPLDLGFTQLKN